MTRVGWLLLALLVVLASAWLFLELRDERTVRVLSSYKQPPTVRVPDPGPFLPLPLITANPGAFQYQRIHGKGTVGRVVSPSAFWVSSEGGARMLAVVLSDDPPKFTLQAGQQVLVQGVVLDPERRAEALQRLDDAARRALEDQEAYLEVTALAVTPSQISRIPGRPR